jgi:hypothetical protein
VVSSSTRTSTVRTGDDLLNDILDIIHSVVQDIAEQIQKYRNLLHFEALEFEAEIEWEPHPSTWGSKSRVSCRIPLQEEILKPLCPQSVCNCANICEPRPNQEPPKCYSCRLIKNNEKGLTIWTGSAPLTFDSFTYNNKFSEDDREEAVETRLEPGNLSAWIWFGPPDAKTLADYYNVENTRKDLGSNLIIKLKSSSIKEFVTLKFTDLHWGSSSQRTYLMNTFMIGFWQLMTSLDPEKKEILLQDTGISNFSIQLLGGWKSESEYTMTKEYVGSASFDINNIPCIIKGKISLKLIDP